MKTFFSKFSVIALFAIVAVSACKDDDDDKGGMKACQNGAFTANINGQSTSATSFNNTLLKGNSGGSAGKRMDIRATDGSGRQLIITISDLSSGSSGDGVSTDPYIPFDDITTGTENSFMFTIIENNVSYTYIDGALDVTSCDASSKQVSGTFSFSDEDLQVTNGTFTNMCYTILQ